MELRAGNNLCSITDPGFEEGGGINKCKERRGGRKIKK